MINVMVDIETLGTNPGSVILSIGAVEFRDGNFLREFYREISPASCQECGLKIDAATVAWWMEQKIKPPVSGYESLEDVLAAFSDWLPEVALLWANSPSFDAVLIEAAYRKVGQSLPWSFRDWRDFRTARDLLAPGFDPATVPTQGDHHDALADAKWQATALMMMGYGS